MKQDKCNISIVATNKLCNTCGACHSICPTNAIHFEETTGGYYLPVVHRELCTNCGICLKICPGLHFGRTIIANMPEDPFVGTALETFVGKASDTAVFENAQSGGVVSALLIHALHTGQIKGAITVCMKSGFPPRPFIQIAKTARGICQAQKSKYCPVPLLVALRDLKEDDLPLAVVGIPCQIHGLFNVLDIMPELKNKIAITIGLVCDRIMTYAGLDYLFAKAEIQEPAPSILHFRDKSVSGYPGDVHIVSDNGESHVLPAFERISIKDYFTPARCRICFDKMNVFSDITIGDPHGLKNADSIKGESLIVVRTPRGKDLINAARNDDKIFTRSIQYEDAIKGQEISSKKSQWRAYAECWRSMGFEMPDYYEKVKDRTRSQDMIDKYLHDLEYSVNLDNFHSRDALINRTSILLIEKRKKQFFRLPGEFSKRLLKKLSFLTHKR